MNVIGNLLFRTLIWALAGAIFGGLYGGLYTMWNQAEATSALSVILALALAGAITAAFFGSMTTALLGAMIGVLCSVVFLIAFSSGEPLLPVPLVAAVIAFFAGRLLPQDENLRVKPLAQTSSGLLAGMFAGPVTATTMSVFDWPPTSIRAAAIGVAGVGILFLVFSRWMAPRCPVWLSSRFSSPIVAATVAATVAAGLWLVGNSLETNSQFSAAEVQAIFAAIPNTVTGGVIGGAAGGLGLALLGIEHGKFRV